MHREAVSIKGTKSGLVILLDSDREFDSIKHHLQSKMESSNGFFKGAKVTFHTGSNKLVPQQQYELESICKKYGLILNTAPNMPEIEELFIPQGSGKKTNAPGEPALLLKQTLRSGQFISRPSHVVILGNVHPGAKVEAGGNIIVMGNCLGTVHAGAHGNREASIIAVYLAPQVLSIADFIYTEPPTPNVNHGLNKAIIKNDKIVFVSK